MSKSWIVRITVEDTPRLGECFLCVKADNREHAAEVALAKMSAAWACGKPFVAEVV